MMTEKYSTAMSTLQVCYWIQSLMSKIPGDGTTRSSPIETQSLPSTSRCIDLHSTPLHSGSGSGGNLVTRCTMQKSSRAPK